ncbi:MAG: AraC family transcriptional regulator [Bacteroidales bacterium]|nr:AraC family transcriptional regulator [Bacteroidales bacterium]
MQIIQEITPLSPDRLYMSMYYYRNQLDFPLHFHEDFELNLTSGARGQRIVGSLSENIEDYDLALLFPNVIHCYKRAEGETCDNCEVTVVQFSKDMPSWRLLNTVQMDKIREMISQPVSGIKFSPRVAKLLKSKIESIAGRSDFDSGLRFLSILQFLATLGPEDTEILGSKNEEVLFSRSQRIRRIIKYTEDNYDKKITLEEIGNLVGMSSSAVSRFFKKRTGHNYWTFLVNYRLECAQRLLTGSDKNISEIAYCCGFNSLSNFNKVFRDQNSLTPKEYRVKFKKSLH